MSEATPKFTTDFGELEYPDHWQLYVLVESLLETLPENHPIRLAAQPHMSAPDDAAPTPEALQKILNDLRALPLAERNGWADLYFHPAMPDPELDREVDGDYLPCLAVTYSGPHLLRELNGTFVQPYSARIWERLVLYIQAGSSKAEVVEGLRAVLDRVERDWDSLVGGGDDATVARRRREGGSLA